MAATCSIDGCDRTVTARGWCGRHWQRWRRTGDPQRSTSNPRRDTARHGTRRSYDLGCRCLPCASANSRYITAWRQGNGARRPASEITAHLQVLIDSGWTRKAIEREAKLGNSTVWTILSGRVSTVNSRTAAAILALEPERRLTLVAPSPRADLPPVRRQVTRDRWSSQQQRQWTGIPDPVLAAARAGTNSRCVDCGGEPLAGGLRCVECFKRVAPPRTVREESA